MDTLKYSVLFVDDDINILSALQRVLHKEPYKILSAKSPEEAFTILSENSVDILVSDEQMPGMSGSDFIAIVRRKYPEIIQMMLTGHASLDVAIRAINVGEIYRFFKKPVNHVDLASTIRQALEHKHLIVESRRLLRKVRHQNSILQQLEQIHPGITKVARNDDDSIIIDEAESADYKTLVQQILIELDDKKSESAANKSEKLL